jgi:hypothetical protein
MALSNLYPAPPVDSGTVIPELAGSRGISGELLSAGGGLASRMLRRIVSGSWCCVAVLWARSFVAVSLVRIASECASVRDVLP